MTDSLLMQANAIRNRTKKIQAILDQLDLTDPSGIDSTPRYSPITISAGMAQTIQFETLPTKTELTEVERLDAQVRDTIIKVLTGYKNSLDKLFTDL